MNSLYVIMTNQCQLNCKFCYTHFVPQFNSQEKRDCIDPEMVIDKINNGIELNGELVKFDNIIFHGGEPLLYPKEIMQIMDGVKDKKIHFEVQTNMAYKTLTQDQLKLLTKLGTYGTSYSYDRFPEYYGCDGECAKSYFEHNIKQLGEMNIRCSVLITVTEEQIKKQNPLFLFEYLKSLGDGVDYIILERPIFPINEVKNNKEKYERFYKEVDAYMLEFCRIADKYYRINIPDYIERIKEYHVPLYHNHCSEFTYTLYNNKLKLGCPSLEVRGYDDKEKISTECLECRYYEYCKSDCECMNIVCAFPKKTFDWYYNKK